MLGRFVSTTETATRRCRRLDGELAKIGEEWSLSDCSANAGHGKAAARAPKATLAVAAVALCMVQQEAERLLHDQQVADGQGCRDPPAPFHNWRDHDDDDGTDGDGSVVGQGSHACVVVVRYRI